MTDQRQQHKETKPMTRSEAYDKGLYTFSPPPVPCVAWSKEDWMRYVTYTVPVTD